MRVRQQELGRRWREIESDVLTAARDVGASGSYVLGAALERFEAELAAAWGLPHAVGVASGLDALEIALRCQEVAPGDRVMTTPLSAFATTLALLRVGAVPVFVDVDDSGLLDLDRVEDGLRRDPEVRGLLPVHLYGQPLDLDGLERLRDAHGLWIVEDCAQAIGATWRGRPVGSASDVAATSFYPTKNLGALGDAGAVLASTPERAARARALRHYGQSAPHVHDHLGLNSRLDELHAAVLSRALLPRWPATTERRREVARRYGAEIRHPALRLPAPAAEGAPVWHLFPLRVTGGRRRSFAAHLEANGIETASHYPTLIPRQPVLERRRHECLGDLGRAQSFADSEISLPIHPELTSEEVDRVVAACNGWGEG
jgi:dTDP-3-amino-3,4,6-trideoxy-alpha-D-glucose transaminase